MGRGATFMGAEGPQTGHSSDLGEGGDQSYREVKRLFTKRYHLEEKDYFGEMCKSWQDVFNLII